MSEIEKMEQELDELKEQFESFVKEYKLFTVMVNETVSGMIEQLIQYASFFEAMYMLLIKNGTIDKAEVDQLAKQFYEETIQTAVGKVEENVPEDMIS